MFSKINDTTAEDKSVGEVIEIDMSRGRAESSIKITTGGKIYERGFCNIPGECTLLLLTGETTLGKKILDGLEALGYKREDVAIQYPPILSKVEVKGGGDVALSR